MDVPSHPRCRPLIRFLRVMLAMLAVPTAWPQGNPPTLRPRPFVITTTDRAHWSLQPLNPGQVPRGEDLPWTPTSPTP